MLKEKNQQAVLMYKLIDEWVYKQYDSGPI